jgi:hypothetical protein
MGVLGVITTPHEEAEEEEEARHHQHQHQHQHYQGEKDEQQQHLELELEPETAPALTYPFFGSGNVSKLVALKVLDYLDNKDVYVMSSVSSYWARASMDDALWEEVGEGEGEGGSLLDSYGVGDGAGQQLWAGPLSLLH